MKLLHKQFFNTNPRTEYATHLCVLRQWEGVVGALGIWPPTLDAFDNIRDGNTFPFQHRTPPAFSTTQPEPKRKEKIMSFLKTVGHLAMAIGVSRVVGDVYEGGKKKAKAWNAKRLGQTPEPDAELEPAGSITQQEPAEERA